MVAHPKPTPKAVPVMAGRPDARAGRRYSRLFGKAYRFQFEWDIRAGNRVAFVEWARTAQNPADLREREVYLEGSQVSIKVVFLVEHFGHGHV